MVSYPIPIPSMALSFSKAPLLSKKLSTAVLDPYSARSRSRSPGSCTSKLRASNWPQGARRKNCGFPLGKPGKPIAIAVARVSAKKNVKWYENHTILRYCLQFQVNRIAYNRTQYIIRRQTTECSLKLNSDPELPSLASIKTHHFTQVGRCLYQLGWPPIPSWVFCSLGALGQPLLLAVAQQA